MRRCDETRACIMKGSSYRLLYVRPSHPVAATPPLLLATSSSATTNNRCDCTAAPACALQMRTRRYNFRENGEENGLRKRFPRKRMRRAMTFCIHPAESSITKRRAKQGEDTTNYENQENRACETERSFFTSHRDASGIS